MKKREKAFQVKIKLLTTRVITKGVTKQNLNNCLFQNKIGG